MQVRLMRVVFQITIRITRKFYNIILDENYLQVTACNTNTLVESHIPAIRADLSNGEVKRRESPSLFGISRKSYSQGSPSPYFGATRCCLAIVYSNGTNFDTARQRGKFILNNHRPHYHDFGNKLEMYIFFVSHFFSNNQLHSTVLQIWGRSICFVNFLHMQHAYSSGNGATGSLSPHATQLSPNLTVPGCVNCCCSQRDATS